jgi:hypothetical protein
MLEVGMGRWACVLAVAVALQATHARADDAGDLKRQADAAFDSKHYDEALRLYDAAYALSPQPSIFYNRGRVHQYLAHYPLALAELERFQREAPPDVMAKVPAFQAILADVRKHVATLNVDCAVAGAHVLVDSVDVGTTPLAPVRVNAGSGRIDVIAEGHLPYHQVVMLRGGETNDVRIALASRDRHGILVVSSRIAGTSITIDDRPVGVVPTETALDQGVHRVRASHDAFSDAITQIAIDPGRRKEVQLDPQRRSSILASPWFWTVVSVVVLGGAATAVTYALVTERPLPSGSFSPGSLHF